MEAFWKQALRFSPVLAIVSFVFYSLFKQWLQLPGLSMLTPRQQFVLFVLFLVLTFAFASIGLYCHMNSPRKGGSVSTSTNIRAGDGGQAAGGDVKIAGGDGHNGASGGDVTLGPGDFRAGDGGQKGDGGSIIIKGGDAK